MGPNTTIYGEESLIENGEIEELHYLSVKVERMKKAMLNKVEGREISKSVLDKHVSAQNTTKKVSGSVIDENDRKEEMLYRSTDLNLAEIQTSGGGDVNNTVVNNNKGASQSMVAGRNTELSTYSEIAVHD